MNACWITWTWATRTALCCALICIAGAGLAACSSDRAEANAARDGGSDSGSDGEDDDTGDANSCGGMHCAPDESPLGTGKHCECSKDGVRMRFAPLSEGFYAQPWPLATRCAPTARSISPAIPAPADRDFRRGQPRDDRARDARLLTNGAIFSELDGALDPDSLPNARAVGRGARPSMQLIEVGAGSKTRGERTPIACAFTAT